MATRGHVAAEPLDRTLADTLADVETETLGDSMGDVETKALIVTLPDTLPDKEVETVFNTLSNVEAEALVDTLADTPEVGSKTLSSRLFDVEHQAVVFALECMVAETPTQLVTHLAMWTPRHWSKRWLTR